MLVTSLARRRLQCPLLGQRLRKERRVCRLRLPGRLETHSNLSAGDKLGLKGQGQKPESCIFSSILLSNLIFFAALFSPARRPFLRSTMTNHPTFAPPSLGPPFTYVAREKPAPDPINYAPRPLPALDLSPQSATSSMSSDASMDAFDSFVRTQSRVVCIIDAPPIQFLASMLAQNGLVPTSMWVRDGDGTCVWALFHSHREACLALSLSAPRFPVAAALEADLTPLKRVLESAPHAISPQLYMNNLRVPAPMAAHGASGVSMVPEEYTLSSNPPNPRTNFRLGDWIPDAYTFLFSIHVVHPTALPITLGLGVLHRTPSFAFSPPRLAFDMLTETFPVCARRNLTCIGCGCPRSPNGTVDAHNHATYNNPPPPSRPPMSPRFVTANNSMHSYSQSSPSHSPTSHGFPVSPRSQSQQYHNAQQQQQPVSLPLSSTLAALNKAASSGYPLLTPSGRAFAVGGKVQNISSDPLTPCIMYWPDNEPFPEQGQIRPSNLMNVAQPPILNTGNRGPISHQPGDWICLKCNYLNWRRRKVCQTCLPYAEGNGDSISAAVQAERIALLTSVLAHTGLGSAPSSPSPPLPVPQREQGHVIPLGRSHSTTPAHAPHRPFVDVSPPPSSVRGPAVHRSQSHSELGAHAFPIYETSGQQHHQHQQPPRFHHHQQSPLHRPIRMSPARHPIELHAPAPAPLLPSFLQDIVQSPTLSPSSTSSADLSFDEYDEDNSLPSSTRSTFSGSGSVRAGSDSPLASTIWRLDGEETKSLVSQTPVFPLPIRRERGVGARGTGSAESSRNSSVERLRLQHVS
ncbi:RanBP2-type domain-containing protein [Mycena chlorophos]|uniref:RanBP2-type domain-containing protein n=1 Tax=Mycena chlorophos TaxID=658473 RepID=A0A8H6TPD2_MYCCL|nr:RanBP2-type domain-containing protein [Mycena chlorophos]